MNLKHLGTVYGGWSVDLDAIADGDTVLDIGVGGDVSFAQELRRLKVVKIILIDPDESCRRLALSVPDSEFVCAAVTITGGNLPLFTSLTSSSSLCRENQNVGSKFKMAQCQSIFDLIKLYCPSLVKLDIEGEEYHVLPRCIGVRQVAVEFHHRLMYNKSASDTENLVSSMLDNKYRVIAVGSHDEYTFLRE